MYASGFSGEMDIPERTQAITPCWRRFGAQHPCRAWCCLGEHRPGSPALSTMMLSILGRVCKAAQHFVLLWELNITTSRKKTEKERKGRKVRQGTVLQTGLSQLLLQDPNAKLLRNKQHSSPGIRGFLVTLKF